MEAEVVEDVEVVVVEDLVLPVEALPAAALVALLVAGLREVDLVVLVVAVLQVVDPATAAA